MATTTRIGTQINAPRSTVYRLLLDGDAVAAWMMPDGISVDVHRFEPVEGGSFSITLTHDEPVDVGETGQHDAGTVRQQHDAYFGTFRSLTSDEQVVEVLEFVTEKPDMTGAQTVTFTLTDAGGGTYLEVLHEGVPAGLGPAENEVGWQMALTKLVALAERGTTD
ncbi:SRPBCC domain-containing protein [Nocardia sp. NPDC058519]|uniref:SRPBCC domain-containing protein n=1 Tax=Nocardia sp. NPDC058519 TaxID=3346535 RepID=UPI003658709A